MEQEIDMQSGAVSRVMQSLYCSVVVRRTMSQKAMLSIYCSVCFPPLTYNYELSIITKRIRSWLQVTEMSLSLS